MVARVVTSSSGSTSGISSTSSSGSTSCYE